MRLLLPVLLLALLAACGGTPSTPLDAGATDAGAPAVDAGRPGYPDAGPAIAAPAETWTWVDFPDTTCGNGQPTGLAVNLTSRSQDVLVYFQGGGACWDKATCLQLQTAINIDTGYTTASFAAEPEVQAAYFSRADATNPVKDASYVFVPYCTGDIYAGDAVQSYDPANPTLQVHHRGARNVQAYLRRLVTTFLAATRVWVTGSSAGGYGAQVNYSRFATAFPDAEVAMLADGAQTVQPSGARWTTMTTAWNAQFPAACPACATDFPSLADYLFTTFPHGRFALLASDQDQTLRTFFGYTPADFAVQTNALLTTRYDPRPNAKYFFLQHSAQHTMLGQYDTEAIGSVTLKAWLGQWARGDAGWASVK